MKKIKFTCSNCLAKLRVPTHLAGVTAPCPKCGAKITAPTDIENIVDDTPRRKTAAPLRAVAGTHAPAREAVSAVSPSREYGGGSAAVVEPVRAVVQNPLPTPDAVAPGAPSRDIPPPESEPLPDYEEIIVESKTIPVVEDSSPVSIQDRAAAPALSEPAPAVAVRNVPVSYPPVPNPPAAAVTFPPLPVPMVESTSSVEGLAVESVVEEPPAVAKTQPIRINPRPSSLPPVRVPDSAAPGELPRLDVSLAGQDSATSMEALMQDGGVSQGRTKVVLPQPGESTDQFVPGDFIVPAEETTQTLTELLADQDSVEERLPEEPVMQEVTAPIEVPELESPVIQEMTAPVEVPAVQEVEELLPPQLSEGGVSSDFPELVDMNSPELSESIDEIEPVERISAEPMAEEFDPLLADPKPLDVFVDLGLDVLEPEEPTKREEKVQAAPDSVNEVGHQFDTAEFAPVDSVVTKAPISEELAEEPVAHEESILDIFAEADRKSEELSAKLETASLSEGSFESLLSEQVESDKENVEEPALPPKRKKLELPVVESRGAKKVEEDQVDDAPALSVNKGTPDSRQDTDVISDLFGASSKNGEGPSKAKVVMISTIGAVAIIATIVMIFAIKALGGLNPGSSSEEEITPPPPAISEARPEPPSGSQTSPAELATFNGDKTPKTIETSAVESDGNTANQVSTPPVKEEPKIEIGGSGNPQTSVAESEQPALSFDERVQNIVNGTGGGSGASKPEKLSAADMVDSAVGQFSTEVGEQASGIVPPPNLIEPDVQALVGAAESDETVKNYNPPESFSAPGPNDAPLGKTHDLLDAYLRAPDWESRIKYTFHGESMRPAIEEYYQKWPDVRIGRFSLQLFQMEQDPDLGGPYWVYLVSQSDEDQGYPVIIREEKGLLKLDWEIYSEFNDRHFVKFQEGSIASPHTLRVVIERVSDYYGLDRDGFKDLDDHYVYQINPPYGDLNEFSDYAFVRKDSPVAAELEEVVGLNDEPLAVIVTLEQQMFSHGVEHLVIKDYVTEGWFR